MANKVTDVQTQKNNKDRVNVYIDNEYAFSCDMELIYKHKIKVGNDIEISSVNEIVEKDNFAKAKRDSLRIIEKSHKTENQIYNKLIKKGYSESIAQKAIEFLKEYNFVNDEKYVEMFINDRIKKYGKNKIRYDLLRKGISEELINKKFHIISSQSEFDTAYELGCKKYNNLSKKEFDQRKIKQKLYQYLISKGYSWDICKNVLERIIKGDMLDY